MLDQKKELFTPEETAILDRVDARLATGISLLRLHLETGIRQDYLASLVQRRHVGGYRRSDSEDTNKALADLEQWLEATPAAHESTESRAETPSFKAMTSILSIAHHSLSVDTDLDVAMFMIDEGDWPRRTQSETPSGVDAGGVFALMD